MLLYSAGSPDTSLSDDDLRNGLRSALEALGPRHKVLAVPPDFTRLPSKAGVLGLTKTLALELAPRKITVNAVCPGIIDTEMTRSIPEKFRRRYLRRIPLKRMGLPEEVSACVQFLASRQASYITGQSISVNGGMYMGG